AFGFPKDAKLSAALYDIVASGEPSASPFLGILAQRLNHLLWRFESTLKYIPADWAEQYKARSEALRELCDPHLVAKRPTLRDVSAALRQESKELRAFTESAPDPTLYAVLRSFDEGDSSLSLGDGGGPQDDREVALDFLSKHVSQLLGGGRVVDDSSNAWWAVRTGLCSGDERFRDLLKGVAHKYYDITVPAEHVSKLGAVPEIYKPIRTSSYTLSNAQAIVERERNLDASLKEQLRQVIYRMLERLLKTPPSKQLYLASVHHEGLSNYLDYVADQEREAAGTNPDSPARCDAEGAPAEEVEK
ncbi:MAG TPA: hypothetical protein VEQ42_13445, partial [Pyrinomonadaceae bacterium]|nr:hypothetical protein [Pyrinomonadaceae bacterium]